MTSSFNLLALILCLGLAAFGHALLIAWLLCQLAAGKLPCRFVKVVDKLLAAQAVVGPVCLLYYLQRYVIHRGELRNVADWPVALIVFTVLFACVAVGWLVLRLVRRGHYRRQMESDQRLVVHASGAEKREQWGALARLYGNQIADLEVNRKTIPVPDLPVALEGVRLIHLSDLHIQRGMPTCFMRRVSEQVSQLAGDIIVISGDFIDNQCIPDWTADELGRISAETPTVYVWGNHDTLALERITQIVAPLGWQHCASDPVAIEFAGQTIRFFGDERPWLSGNLPQRQLSEAFDIAVCHSPDSWAAALRCGFPLSLAGHTHGGQFRFPLIGPIVAPSRHGGYYCCGVFEDAGRVLHVSRGLHGTYPLRYGCLPEVTALTLTKSTD